MGQVHFWLVMVGMTLAFFPMHWLGMAGMPRRIYTYHGDMGWDLWNLVSTVGAFTIALGVLVFLVNVWVSLRSGERASSDPWDGASLEWKTSSPPPVYNFAVIPVVHSRRPFWDEKYGSGGHVPAPSTEPMGAAVHAATGYLPSGAMPSPSADFAEGIGAHALPAEEHFHMPSPSIYPAILALGVLVMMFGLLYMKDLPSIDPLPFNPIVILVGVVILLYSALQWQGEISAGK
jgi:cytochrome c oxidase subunit 1